MIERRINDQDARLADYVVMLDAGAATSYRRLRHEVFEQCARFPYGRDDWFVMLRNALGSLGSVSQVDVILDEPVSLAEASDLTTVSGWSIFEMSNIIEVVVNDLFSKQARIVRIERRVINKAADVIRQSGSAMGRLFFTRPSRDFRYSVFCQFGTGLSSAVVCRNTQVSFAVGLPQFRSASAQDAAAMVANHEINERAVHETRASEQIEDQLVPVSATFSELSASKAAASAAKDVWQQGDPVNGAACVALVEASLLLSAESDPISSVHCAPAVQGDTIRAPEVTVCILLDAKVDTAIAAAAYLTQRSARVPVVEVGLWRRKLKSNFQRFHPVNDIFEFSRLPLSVKDLQDLSAFFAQLKTSRDRATPAVVLGEEILATRSLSEVLEVLHAAFDRCHLVLFGQDDRVNEVYGQELRQVLDSGMTCVTVKAGELHAVKPGLVDPIAESLRCAIPIHMKQHILMAEKKGTAHQVTREVAQHILGSPPCADARDGLAYRQPFDVD